MRRSLLSAGHLSHEIHLSHEQVFNRSTYGHFEQFLEMLGVDSEESDMRSVARLLARAHVRTQTPNALPFFLSLSLTLSPSLSAHHMREQ